MVYKDVPQHGTNIIQLLLNHMGDQHPQNLFENIAAFNEKLLGHRRVFRTDNSSSFKTSYVTCKLQATAHKMPEAVSHLAAFKTPNREALSICRNRLELLNLTIGRCGIE